MKRKDRVLETIKKIGDSNGICTKDLANYLNLNRSNVSYILNILVKEKKLKKSNTRPVYFSLLKEKNHEEILSLEVIVDKAKKSILKPQKQSKILLLGNQEAYKSKVANIIFDAILQREPFFLKSNLNFFDCQKQILEKKDIDFIKALYLKNFNKISYLKQEEILKNFNGRLLIASCDDSSFLEKKILKFFKTKIQIPDLEEKIIQNSNCIEKIFIQESERISKEIFVSKETLKCLLKAKEELEIKEIQQIIKQIVKKSYNEFLVNTKRRISIEKRDLPSWIRKFSNDLDQDFKVFRKHIDILQKKKEVVYFIESFEDWLHKLQHIDAKDLLKLQEVFNKYCEQIIKKSMQFNYKATNEKVFLKLLDLINQITQRKLSKTIERKYKKAFLIHLIMSVERSFNDNFKIPIELLRLKENFQIESQTAYQVTQMVRNYLNVQLYNQEEFLIFLFLIFGFKTSNLSEEPIQILVALYGNNTSSSIKECICNITGYNNVYSFDSGFDCDEMKLIQSIRSYLKKNPKESLIFVDAWLVSLIRKKLADLEFVKIVSYQSIAQVVRVANKAKKIRLMHPLYQVALAFNEDYKALLEGKKAKDKIYIVCANVCSDGMDVIDKDEISGHLRMDKSLFEIIHIDMLSKDSLIDALDNLKQLGIKISMIISFCKIENLNTTKKHRLNKTLTKEDVETIQKFINLKTTRFKCIDILKEEFPNQNILVIYNEIQSLMKEIELEYEINFDDESFLGIVFYLVHRLKKRIVTHDFSKEKASIKSYEKEIIFLNLKQKLMLFEYKYDLKISDEEIIYLIETIKSHKKNP